VNGSALYADVPEFKSPAIITGDTYRPDLLLSLSNGSLYVANSLLAMKQTFGTMLIGKKPNIKNY
jgi:hypothetical protein